MKHLGVRELVEFVMRQGDLVPTSSNNTALRGSKIHRQLQATHHGQNYQKEVYLKQIVTIDHQDYQIDGRADGIFQRQQHDVIEEIKTSRPAFEALSTAKLARYWGQVKIYGYFWCMQHHLNTVELCLTYVQTSNNTVTHHYQTWQYDDLKKFFKTLIKEYEEWLIFKDDLINKRNQALQTMVFPFPHLRHGQQTLMTKVYQTIQAKQQLLVEAPTGIGKTIATLFPALKAMGNNQIQRLFYLTAKQSTRQIVENTLSLLAQQQTAFPVKCITLTAKEQITFADEPADPHQNPYMQGYYDRLKPALQDTITHYNLITRQVIEQQARKYMLDPFNFAMDLSNYCDIIICDYNYVFDPTIALQRFLNSDETDSNFFLIDEAHNLLKRAREMYSATLSSAPLRKINNALQKDTSQVSAQLQQQLPSVIAAFTDLISGDNQVVLTQPPQALTQALQKLVHYLGTWLPKYERNAAQPLLTTIKEYYFNCLTYLKINDYYEQTYKTIVTTTRNYVKVELCCLDPSLFINNRLQKARGAVLFSATLSPLTYYQNVLGLNEDSWQLQLPSPFSPTNQLTVIADYIQTTYQQRTANIDKIVAAITALTHSKHGNYLIFFPSFAFLKQVASHLPDDDNTQVLIQKTHMDSQQRQQFLSQFETTHQRTLIGLGVLGGIFAEGIDLKGEKLIGVAIISVGLPQINLKNNLLRAYFDKQNGQGFSYAYLIPGMNNIIQAAGRLIRSDNDRGIVLLIDQRFNYRQYQQLLPPTWQPHSVHTLTQLQQQITHFW